ncbi:MAG: succinate--CoA ligase subunit alpha [Actinomycetota bacterium]|nr:succinate--CoA ligase subunit alpha [Actinomycetota bacterium]
MAILIGRDTKLVVQGLTGREGSFHAKRNQEYGTDLVAGVTPGKGGSDVSGTPVFDTVERAVSETGANAALVFVPPRFAADAILEAHDAGIEVIIAVTEGVPALDMARVVAHMMGSGNGVHLIGPNCPGVITPEVANVGIIPGEICSEGPVGLVSRSGTLTYQIVHELTQKGVGQSTCVGIGGDPIPGSNFIDILELFEQDQATEFVVMVGEIGGDAEERAAEWSNANMTKPIVAYIAGLTAPEGKRMGHAGAIVSGSKGTAKAKIEALEGAGIRVGRNPTEVAEIVAEIKG